jgi:hypothetical protein
LADFFSSTELKLTPKAVDIILNIAKVLKALKVAISYISKRCNIKPYDLQTNNWELAVAELDIWLMDNELRLKEPRKGKEMALFKSVKEKYQRNLEAHQRDFEEWKPKQPANLPSDKALDTKLDNILSDITAEQVDLYTCVAQILTIAEVQGTWDDDQVDAVVAHYQAIIDKNPNEEANIIAMLQNFTTKDSAKERANKWFTEIILAAEEDVAVVGAEIQ